MEWYLRALKKYADFSGRAHRREYWMFVLWNLVFSLALSIVDRALDLEMGEEPFTIGAISLVYSLALVIPGLSIGARRLHDIGRSGWWQLIGVIPIVGIVVLIIWWATQGQTGPNEHGPDPRFSGGADTAA